MIARPERCSVAARQRGDELYATAPPARGFLLLEAPGPWGPDLAPASGPSSRVSAALAGAAARDGVRLLLIRRPGPHPAGPGPRRWAVAAVGGAIRWGEWTTEADLARLDVEEEFGAAAVGPVDGLPTALVCTQGRHDLCCALEGRPVVTALASDPRIDLWECSHLGGDRFAANLLLLPSGRLFGGLDASTAQPALAAALDGRVQLDHFRGTCGQATPAQAAQWHLMRQLGEDRPDRVRVLMTPPLPAEGVPFAVFARHGDAGYRVAMRWEWAAPRHLTCRGPADARVRVYRLATTNPTTTP